MKPETIYVCGECKNTTTYDNRPCDICDAHYDCFEKYIPLSSVTELVEAARFMCKKYKELADSGDAGFWEAENQEEYADLMKSLASFEGVSDDKEE